MFLDLFFRSPAEGAGLSRWMNKVLTHHDVLFCSIKKELSVLSSAQNGKTGNLKFELEDWKRYLGYSRIECFARMQSKKSQNYNQQQDDSS